MVRDVRELVMNGELCGCWRVLVRGIPPRFRRLVAEGKRLLIERIVMETEDVLREGV